MDDPDNTIPVRNLKEKKHILAYYILEKQLKFMDAVRDYDGTSNQQADAINIFNDPFDEERQFDLQRLVKKTDQVNGFASRLQVKSKADQKNRRKQSMKITGGYTQDIECLMELDIIDELIDTDSE